MKLKNKEFKMPFRPLTDEEKKMWNKPKCISNEHNPPGMIVLSPGTHIWVCPCCKKETRIEIQHKFCYGH